MLFGDMPLEDFLAQFSKDLSPAMALPGKYNMPHDYLFFSGSGGDNFVEATKTTIFPSSTPRKRRPGRCSALLRHKEIRERQALPPAVPPPKSPGSGKTHPGWPIAHGQHALDESAAKRVLALYGVPVTRERLAAGRGCGAGRRSRRSAIRSRLRPATGRSCTSQGRV